MSKKSPGSIVALVVVLAGVVAFFLLNAGSIVKSAIEKYGSEATKTAVRVSGVTLSLKSGEGALSGLSVGNPVGFSSGKALTLGHISIKLDPASVTGTGPVIIEEIKVEKPQVNYEMTPTGDSNLNAIARNAKAYAGTGKDNAAPAGSKDQGRKIVIRKLTIDGGEISIVNPLLKGPALTAKMAKINMTNIGQNGGTSPAQVAQLLVSTISSGAVRSASSVASQALGGIKDLGGAAVKNAPADLGKIKNIFGK